MNSLMVLVDSPDFAEKTGLCELSKMCSKCEKHPQSCGLSSFNKVKNADPIKKKKKALLVGTSMDMAG